jgi:ribosome-associated protein
MSRIPVNSRLSIDETEVSETFIRAQGAGGQNVNKVSSAVQLRFDAAGSPSLPDDIKARLIKLAGHRATLAGEIIITAQEHRLQSRNRDEALTRLLDLIREAALPPPPKRRATKPTKGSKVRRLDGKSLRGKIKSLRGKPSE